MAAPPPVTDTFARFVTETPFSSISREAIANAKLHILDALGVALAAVSTPVATIALDYGAGLGRSNDAAVWGTAMRASAPEAAFLNGLLAHALDYDDWDAFVNAGHPTGMIAAATVSLGEKVGASGTALLKGYVLAIEVITKIAGHSPNLHDRGFHSTPVWGSLGATIACAILLGLDRARLCAALGTAASGIGGLHRQQGSMVKPFHAGNAARNGVEAVLLAAKGFTADSDIIESPRGFCDTFFGPGACDYDGMTRNLGRPYFLESPGLGLKLHPCSAPQFLAADAALHLRRLHGIHSDDIASVEIRVPPKRYQRHYHPEVRNGLRGKFAVNYVVAVALLDGRLGIESFTDEKANRPEVQETLRKVEVVRDESIPEPGRTCPLTVRLRSGEVFSYTARVAKGHPENPLSESEVLEKFHDNAGTAFEPERSAEIVETVRRLESLPNLQRLAALLARP